MANKLVGGPPLPILLPTFVGLNANMIFKTYQWCTDVGIRSIVYKCLTSSYLFKVIATLWLFSGLHLSLQEKVSMSLYLTQRHIVLWFSRNFLFREIYFCPTYQSIVCLLLFVRFVQKCLCFFNCPKNSDIFPWGIRFLLVICALLLSLGSS